MCFFLILMKNHIGVDLFLLFVGTCRYYLSESKSLTMQWHVEGYQNIFINIASFESINYSN